MENPDEKEIYLYGMTHEELDKFIKESDLYAYYQYCRFQINFDEEEEDEE